jgi:hypothetical protein
MNEPKGEKSKSRTRLDAIGAAVRPARKAKAVEIEFVDASGSDFVVLLARPAAADLIMHLVDALSAEEGRAGPTERMREAQLLLRALIKPHIRKARWVAQRLGVADSVISQWRSGKAVPTEVRLDQLRKLVKSTTRPG